MSKPPEPTLLYPRHEFAQHEKEQDGVPHFKLPCCLVYGGVVWAILWGKVFIFQFFG